MAATAPLPTPRALGEAGLVCLESTHDGLCHVVEEEHYAAELATTRDVGPARIRALCADVLLLGSLAEQPRPVCDRCAADAARRAAVHEHGRRDRPGLLSRIVLVAARCSVGGARMRPRG